MHQSSAFSSAASSYLQSFTQGPVFTNLGGQLLFALPQSVIGSIQSNPGSLLPIPTTSFDLRSFATSPPTSFPQLPWESMLSNNQDVASSVDSVRTSAVLALATSAQSVLGTSVPISSGAARSSSGSMNAAAPAAQITGRPVVYAGAAGAMALAMAL